MYLEAWILSLILRYAKTDHISIRRLGVSTASCSFTKFTLDLSYEEAQVMTHICATCLRSILPFSAVELWNTFSWTWFIFHTESFSESTKIRLQMQAHSAQCCNPHENTIHSIIGCSCYLHCHIWSKECFKCLWTSPPRMVSRECGADLFFFKKAFTCKALHKLFLHLFQT